MDKQKERQMLEKIASSYYEPHMTGVERTLNRFIAEYIVNFCEGDTLEMGVGDGIWLDVLIGKLGSIDIVDVVEEFLLRHKKVYGDKINTFLSLFEDFRPNKKYDTINMAHILEHVYDPVEVLSLAKGWLKEKGVINIMVPHANSLHRRLGVILGINKTTTELNSLDKEMGHRRVYDILTLKKHIKQSGLRIITEKGIFLKVIHNARMEGWGEDLIKGLFTLGLELPTEFAGSLFFQCKM